MSRTFKIIMYFIPFVALSAGICFTALKGAGLYPDVSWPLLIVFDCTTVLYCVLGAFIAQICEDKDNNLKPKIVFIGKIIISLVIVIQWNFISYMIPSREFWAFFALFILVSVFFLSSKYVLINIITVVISMVISWIILPDVLLPARNANFVPELILRCVLIFFVCVLLYLITFVVEKLLVKELENIAEYDSLTLLRNRRTLNMFLDQAIDNNEKLNQPFSFLMADIDDFKIINDTYGHPFGDIVLRNIAKIFILNLGDVCRIFRYGGEEVCAIIPYKLDEATKLVENIRKQIEETIHSQGSISVKVTMSIGIVEYKNGMDKESIIKAADANLYYAKNHGKNKVVN